jgi:exo-1,4-beta-D-glucosaminidase
MLGPYAWVPPNYWSNPVALEEFGGPTGFSTEISPGASPLTLESWLKTAGTEAGCLDEGGAYADVWNFHAGNQHGVFRSLNHFVPSLQLRYGGQFVNDDVAHSSTAAGAASRNSSEACRDSSDLLVEFLAKSQVATYESHRAMFEAYGGAKYVATGVIQWMLNNGLPQHIWHLYDSYLEGGGAYYGSQRAMEPLHAQYDSFDGSVKIVNSLYTAVGEDSFNLLIRRISLNGTELSRQLLSVPQVDADGVLPMAVLDLDESALMSNNAGGVILLRLDLIRQTSSVLTAIYDGVDPKPNTYWISGQPDVVNWEDCNFYVCNITSGENFTALERLPSVQSKLVTTVSSVCPEGQLPRPPTSDGDLPCTEVEVVNMANNTVAFHVHLRLFDMSQGGASESESAVAYWDDNYITLLPLESRILRVSYLYITSVQFLGVHCAFFLYQATTTSPVLHPKVIAEAFNDATASATAS